MIDSCDFQVYVCDSAALTPMTTAQTLAPNNISSPNARARIHNILA